MKTVQECLEMLGFRAEDSVTGFKGVVTSIGFDLPGCIQASISPGLKADGSVGDAYWFDVNRIKITSSKPVMKQPTFTMAIEDTSGPMVKAGRY